MTRINVGIHPSKLCNRHLLAEHREIKRIPNMIRGGKCRMDSIPGEFTLGTGHVKFFYNKLQYLKNRYNALHSECIRRGFNVADYSDSFNGLPCELMNDYAPTAADMELIAARINQKLNMMHESKEWYL